ncbi:uncharacterized protein LOC121392196 [Gigantopelta aegis]|uniref:uncharacterized protein LOC121392196 n=1 Tax=Gigantopelta aegis TaxID=1735272 RepID=UPI001B889D49|nr:uncharacterized protein LOC121392196 [Gigantopelta aegis]
MSTCRILAVLVVLAVFSHSVHSKYVIPCNEGRQFCGHVRPDGRAECPQDTGRVLDAFCEDGAPCCVGADPCDWNDNCHSSCPRVVSWRCWSYWPFSVTAFIARTLFHVTKGDNSVDMSDLTDGPYALKILEESSVLFVKMVRRAV